MADGPADESEERKRDIQTSAVPRERERDIQTSAVPRERERDIQTSAVPRWLALVVLCALLAAAVLSVRAVLS